MLLALQKAIEINEGLDNTADLAMNYYHLSLICWHCGNIREPEDGLQKAIRIAELLHDYARLDTCYRQAEILMAQLGRNDEAREFGVKRSSLPKPSANSLL
jgi:hypothetical protein